MIILKLTWTNHVNLSFRLTNEDKFLDTILVASNSSQAVIQANTVWGVLRGLESFSQLIYKDFNGSVIIFNLVSIHIAFSGGCKQLLLMITPDSPIEE